MNRSFVLALAGLAALGAAGAWAQGAPGDERGLRVKSAEEAGVAEYDPARLHAIVIGIDAYTPGGEWPRLRCAAEDARAVAETLRGSFGVGHLALLLDEQATRRAILKALDGALRLTEQDNLLVYYAGHGWMDEARNGYWVPADAGSDKFEYISNNQIVGDYFRKYKVRHLLVVADSCFSGAMLRGGRAQRPADWVLPAGFRKPSRWVLTSGDLAPVPDGTADHSPFAERLLQYMKCSDKPAFGVLDLYTYVRETLKSESLCAPLDTQKHMPGGEFVFCRLTTPIGPPPAPREEPVEGPKRLKLTGRLIVRSPAEGMVSIDGGQTYAIGPDEPLEWEKYAVGRHQAAVTSGEKTWRQSFEIRENQTTTLEAAFGPETGKPPSTGSGRGMTVDLGNGVGMEFVWIPPGEFTMGSPGNEAGRQDDETQHQVKLTKGFWLGKYEVTQEQWERVMGSNPSHFKNAGKTAPVENVSWNDCQEFIRKLNGVSGALAWAGGGGAGGQMFRLPTEAEWEYACRAGTTTRFSTGDSDSDLDRAGWYGGNSGNTTHPVGQKAPNAWGLYDMHGNVWKWCEDWHGAYPSETAVNPIGPRTGSLRVFRGGSRDNNAGLCRSAYRSGLAPWRPRGRILGLPPRACLAVVRHPNEGGRIAK